MRHIISSLLFVFLFVSCGIRQTRTMINSGDYDGAIHNSVANLRTNKAAKGKQDYIYLLEEAFAKAKERDMRNIDAWAREGNPSAYEAIFNTYIRLHERQELIRPLLPLRYLKENRNAVFRFEDYTDQIIDSKNALSQFLYDNAQKLLQNGTKMDARRSYEDLLYLDKINPGYKNIRQLMEEAQFKGTDFVHISTHNETNMIIPVRLQNDLLDFSTFGLNDRWTVYHSNPLKNIEYDFGMILNFREILISPEQIREKQFVKEKQVKDGVQDLLDSQGNTVKDSLGNAIKVDKFKTVTVSIYEFTQFKSCQVVAKIDYLDYKTNQLIDAFPINSEFIFEHIYATYNGDKRAADESYYSYFDRRSVPFPSNEQMVYDTGEDLKLKLKNIISRNRFRR